MFENYVNLLTLPDTGFFGLAITASRPATCKIFNFDNNDQALGTNSIKVTLYPTMEKNLIVVHYDDDVSTLKKWASLIG